MGQVMTCDWVIIWVCGFVRGFLCYWFASLELVSRGHVFHRTIGLVGLLVGRVPIALICILGLVWSNRK